MPTNLELKIPLDSFEPTVELLKDINAEYKEILNQKDIYYTVNAGLLKLRLLNKQAELILYNRDENSKDRYSDLKY